MSERKVLNKYYPPDFDPAKIPRLHLPKDRQYTVRLMAPCNMKCKTCGEYIYKGKKFNARKETVIGEDYLGLKIFRFYIKCTRCLAEITFKTDPENADYIVEHGATRNFQALKLAEEQAEREQREKDEEEASNPMKLLEKRTQQSKQEMEVLESLEELRDLQQRHANIDYEKILSQHTDHAEMVRKRQEQEDEDFIRAVFKKDANDVIEKRILDDDDDSEEESSARVMQSRSNMNVDKPTDLLSTETLGNSATANKKVNVWEKSLGSLSSKSSLASLVKPRATTSTTARPDLVAGTPSTSQPLTVPVRSSGMSSRSTLTGLVRPKVASATITSLANSAPPAPTPTLNGLGLIGAYSESSSEEDG